MRWHAHDDNPPMMGGGYTVLVDGEEVADVTELDTEAGYVVAHCTADRPDHGSDPHRDPEDHAEVCTVRREGYVEVLAPNGARLA